MSRLSALAAHPRRTVSALAVVLAAVGVTVGSGANFTAHSANPSNTFTAGTLTIGTSSASALFTAGNMKPGDSANGTVDIANTGSVPGAFTLTTTNAADSAGVSLLGQLDVRIEDCGVFTDSTAPTCGSGTVLATTKVKTIGTQSLGTFAAGEKHRYRFDVTLPAATDNNFQGKTASVEFDWNAATN